MTFDYDLFVIGGGSGGVRAARVAAGIYYGSIVSARAGKVERVAAPEGSTAMKRAVRRAALKPS